MRACAVVASACAVFALAAPHDARASFAPSTAGASFGPILARPENGQRWCDLREPVCVHVDPRAPDALSDGDRTRLEVASAHAYSLMIETLGMPRPLFDDAAGGDARLDVYVTREASRFDAQGVFVGRDALRWIEARAAAPAFLAIDPRVVREGGCALDAALAGAMGRASAAGLDLAETRVVVRGLTDYLGELAAPCGGADRRALVQREPWRAVTDSPARVESLARFLDVDRGEGDARIIPVLLSMGAGPAQLVVPHGDDELGAARFQNVPSVFDVLSETETSHNRTLSDLLLEWASARLDVEPSPKLEWHVALSTFPRRLLVPRGIEATGATYVKLDIDRTPKADEIEIDFKWDAGARFRWTVIKADARGRQVGEIGVADLESGRELTVEVRGLEGVTTVYVVGVNGGELAPPWRPDDPLGLAHGYELGLFETEP